jgi:SWI/SNF-related matrix-associated actin-dependent regulator of chromatin subfamily D
LSHTVSGQVWQTGGASSFDGTNVNPETGEGVPAWQLKLEGRLLEVSFVIFLIMATSTRYIMYIQLPNQRAKDRPTARKLSTFIKKIFIELDRDRALYPEGNTAEVGAGCELWKTYFLT